MGLRETLNENPRLTTGLTAGIIVIVLAFILWPSGGGGGGGAGTRDSEIYFSIDDGKSWFADSARKVPPFQKDGKEAVRARVFKSGGKDAVNHLERYTPDAAKKLQALYDANKPMNDPTLFEQITQNGLEVKKPGDAKWTKMSDPNVGKIVAPKDPNAEEVNP